MILPCSFQRWLAPFTQQQKRAILTGLQDIYEKPEGMKSYKLMIFQQQTSHQQVITDP